ncbi:hypothetical protein ASV31_11180 [Enterobacter hormaechei subsp. hoffmannii]|uniref:Uncharacterized protein n=3 Tax=Enterobacter hormaechei TaxID=158836 RepID=A0A855VER5_9ENTR|nr:hypothetical protein AM429_09830 [Enterobacter cloacae complex sp.]AVU19124.1 hypothetical protein AO413_05675 [Enterobacter cloacae]KJN15149.1 hypothetical protein SS58_13100 [Enterobacter hormaechei subsp. hoffmannii]PTX87625.1 hypothetical protein C1O12_04125 [Enterobacter hormaechei]KJN86640.1 hypothetical protein SS04_19275 [Enterobacter hormaechei subsp. hoffmannii]
MAGGTFISKRLIRWGGLIRKVLPFIQSPSLVSMDTVVLFKPLLAGWIIREVMSCIIKLALILLSLLNIPQIICKIPMLQILRPD